MRYRIYLTKPIPASSVAMKLQREFNGSVKVLKSGATQRGVPYVDVRVQDEDVTETELELADLGSTQISSIEKIEQTRNKNSRYLEKVMRKTVKKNSDSVITLSENVQIPGTEYLLEKGDKIRILSEGTHRIGKLQFEPFSQNDWAAYSGAEKFPNGDEPLIAERSTRFGGYIIYIIHGGGIEILYASHESDVDSPEVWTKDWNPEVMPGSADAAIEEAPYAVGLDEIFAGFRLQTMLPRSYMKRIM